MLYESEQAVWLGQCFLSTANNEFLTLYGNLRNADLCALQALSYKNTLLAACTLCGNLLIAVPSTSRGDSPLCRAVKPFVMLCIQVMCVRPPVIVGHSL